MPSKRTVVMIVSLIVATVSLLLLSPATVTAAETCPEGAADCFMCGDTPCTKECVGVYNEAADKMISCNCPQDEPCVCYCPYAAPIDKDCADDPKCLMEHFDKFGGATGIFSHISGNVKLIKAVTEEEIQVTPMTIINNGDTIVIEHNGSAAMIFPGGNIRTIFGESVITIEETNDDLIIQAQGEFWLSHMAGAFWQELQHIKNNKVKTTTIRGCAAYGPEVLADSEPEHIYGCINYIPYSEVLFDISATEQTVKVIQGQVDILNTSGESMSLFTGQSVFIDNPDSLSGVFPEVYDFSQQTLWWTEGYEDQTCDVSCGNGIEQTPYPGCSCLTTTDNGDVENFEYESPEDEPLGGLYSPFCICIPVCLVIIVIIIGVIAFLVFRKKKPDSK